MRRPIVAAFVLLSGLAATVVARPAGLPLAPPPEGVPGTEAPPDETSPPEPSDDAAAPAPAEDPDAPAQPPAEAPEEPDMKAVPLETERAAPKEEPAIVVESGGLVPKCARDVRAAEEARAAEKEKESAESGLVAIEGDEMSAERALYEEAVGRYVDAANDFRGEIQSELRAEVERRRASVTRHYNRLSAEIESEENKRRDEAIARFENFIRRYPDHQQYTPDAMFRLAELYYERSAVLYEASRQNYDKQRELYERGKVPVEPSMGLRDHTDTIAVYRKLLARFGNDYRYADAVYYLLGYVLEEAGQDVAARESWSELVGNFPQSDYAPEVYLRIGEIHFDYGEFADAAASYSAALNYPESQYYDKALYKLAWTYFQLYDYDQAIKTFKRLIGYYDANKGKEGDTASALREEAIDYLAKSLAEDDWDNDGLKDEDAGVARALSYLNEGKPFEVDIIERYAASLYDLHDREKYSEAIEVYRALIARQPLSPKAATFQQQIVKIYDVLRDVDNATRERQRLADMFRPDSPWAEANMEHIRTVRDAAVAVERALRERALWFHQRAQELKAQAAIESRPGLLDEATEHYRKAAEAYSVYLGQYPNEPASYEMSFYLAETYYYSDQFRKAAEAYEAVAKNEHQDQYREQAAWSAIKSYERILTDMVSSGELETRADPGADWQPAPPAAEEESAEAGNDGQTHSVPTDPYPQQVVDWIDAVDYYIMSDMQREGHRDAQAVVAYQAGEIAYRYKHFGEARDRYKQVLACNADADVAGDAIANIINTYREENDFPNLEKWADLAEKMNLGDPDQQEALRKEIKLFKLGAQFQNAEQALEDKQYLAAAREFERLADENPDAKFADKAYFNAAMAYKQERYYDSASRIFEKLVTDARYKKSDFAEESLFELAENYKLFFYFDKAIAAYQAHVRRYPRSKNRAYALYQSGRLQEQVGDYKNAAETYERYANVFATRDDAAAALYRAGELYKKLEQRGEEERIWKAFVERYANAPKLDTLVLQATLELAELAKERNRISLATRYWREVVKEFEARQLQPETPAALAAARSRYELIEQHFKEYKAIKLKGSQKRMSALLLRKKKLLAELQTEYTDIFPYKALDWTICGYYRLGDLYREFAQALYDAPQPGGLSDEELDAYITMIEDEGLKYENVAIERFATTVEQSRRLKVTNKCARQALEAINRYQPDKYPLYKEELSRTAFEPLYTIDTDELEVTP